MNRIPYSRVTCLFIFCSCFLLGGCGSKILWNNIFRYDKEFSGKVLDLNSKQPIENFVVMTAWYRGTAGGSRYYDTAETLTNNLGEFKLPGQGFVFSMNERQVFLFKAGYESIDGNFYNKLANQQPNYQILDGKHVFMMKKLSVEERRNSRQPHTPPFEAPFEKVKLMLKEMKKDDIERGLDPRGLWDGHHY